MASRSPKRAAWPVALLLSSLVACDGCRGTSRTVAPAPPVTPPGFAGQSARLASVPAGWEKGETLFSADGRQVAFVATQGQQFAVFHGGTMSKTYQGAMGLVFREGRGGLAFIASQGGRNLVVVDGEEGAGYDEVRPVRFAPDGRVIYAAASKQQWVIVVGTRATAIPGPADPSPQLSADGKKLVFAELQAETGTTHLRACSLELTACTQGGAYDEIAFLRSDPSRVRLAFVAGRGGKQAVGLVSLDQPGLGEELGAWYDEVVACALSEGGRHLAFLARRGQAYLLVKDGVEVPLAEAMVPIELVVSRNGTVLATGASGGRMVALLDGKPDVPRHDGATSPTFSPDGTGYAYAAGDDSSGVVVVNGAVGPAFDKTVAPRFSPDGSRVAYRARSQGERFVVVADGQGKTIRELPHHQEVYQVAFSPDGTSIGFGARTGSELWWRVERL
jgi:Tol biopolymer transport system component